MNRSCLCLLLGIVALLALGCSQTPEQRLTGTWVTPQEKDAPEQKSGSKGGGLGDVVSGLIKEAKSSVRLEVVFRGDGTGSRTDSALGFSHVEEGFWKVAEAKDDTATVHISAQADFQDYRTWHVTFVGSDRLRVQLPVLGEVELVRHPGR